MSAYLPVKSASDMLIQEDFATMIQKHNTIMSIASDHGTPSTTIQAAYSGAITLTYHSKWDELFSDDVNVLKCNLTVRGTEEKLIYAIQNLSGLCKKFKKNNAFLRAWDAENT